MSKRVPRTRQESKQATRAALIAAGLVEFERDGLDASLDAICERAGLTRGAFYVHFADRDAFVVAVMQHVLGGFVAALAVLRGAGGIARVLKMYIAAVDARAPAVTGGSAVRMQHLMEACRRSATVGGAYRELIMTARDHLADAIAIDQHAGRIRRDVTARVLADLMVLVALGFSARHELGVPIELPAVGRALLAICA